MPRHCDALTLCLQWMHVVLPYLQVYTVLLVGFHAFPTYMGPVQCIVLISKLLREEKSIPSHFKQNRTARTGSFSVLLQQCLSKLRGRYGPKWVQNWQFSTRVQTF